MTTSMKLLLCAVVAHALQGPQLRRTRTILKATRTEQILQHLKSEGDGLGAGAAGTLAGLRALDARWEAMRRPTCPQIAQIGGGSDCRDAASGAGVWLLSFCLVNYSCATSSDSLSVE